MPPLNQSSARSIAAPPPSRRMSPASGPCATRPMPLPVQRGEQEAGVRIAEIGFRPRRRVHLRDCLRRDPVRTIAAHREPHRIEAGIVGAVEQGGATACVVAGEMPVFGKALFVESAATRRCAPPPAPRPPARSRFNRFPGAQIAILTMRPASVLVSRGTTQ